MAPKRAYYLGAFKKYGSVKLEKIEQYAARGPFAKYVISKWPNTKYLLEEYPRGGGYIKLGWFSTMDKAKEKAFSRELGKLD